jgi:UDP-N-acetylglucosamine 2-epimerase (non-hydrolysing)
MKKPLAILVIAGTRPETIKLAPIVIESKSRNDIRTSFCLTGQHRELADEVVDFFELQPDYRLDVMRENQDLPGVISRILDGLKPVIQEAKPDVVLVQGDTLTCFAAGLAAFLAKIPVCHVEAGLRTHDIYSPFPEEALRQMVTRIASIHFAATEANRINLLAEKVPEKDIVVTGNTVIDALFWAKKRVLADTDSPAKLFSADIAVKFESYARLVLITGHRRENFGDRFDEICQALAISARNNPDVLFVYPVHPNPNVLRPVREKLGTFSNVLLLPPLNYPAFVYLMNRCYFVITDSGGVQEEAPALGKPVLVTRNETERNEAVETGQVQLIGTSTAGIVEAVHHLLTDPVRYAKMVREHSPYGDGKAASRIVSSTLEYLQER